MLPMCFLLLSFLSLALVHSQVYNAAPGNRERKILLGPFNVSNQSACELACNCARGDAREVIFVLLKEECAQFIGVVQPVACLIYYYTDSFCSFLGDYTPNTCMKPIVEHHLEDPWCRPAGIWSEWTSTGTCPTKCGSCSNLPRTRTCTNKCVDGSPCPCIGISEDIGPCGIALCDFPATQTCCSPYNKELNENSKGFFCGPPALACKP